MQLADQRMAVWFMLNETRESKWKFRLKKGGAADP